jgi:hypothetical protein
MSPLRLPFRMELATDMGARAPNPLTARRMPGATL